MLVMMLTSWCATLYFTACEIAVQWRLEKKFLSCLHEVDSWFSLSGLPESDMLASFLPPFQYKMEASFLEIYNETLRDLLSSPTPSDATRLEIKLDPKTPGEVYVTNLTPTVVTSQAQVHRNLMSLLSMGNPFLEIA